MPRTQLLAARPLTRSCCLLVVLLPLTAAAQPAALPNNPFADAPPASKPTAEPGPAAPPAAQAPPPADIAGPAAPTSSAAQGAPPSAADASAASKPAEPPAATPPTGSPASEPAAVSGSPASTAPPPPHPPVSFTAAQLDENRRAWRAAHSPTSLPAPSAPNPYFAAPQREPAIRFTPELELRTRGEVVGDQYNYATTGALPSTGQQSVRTRVRAGITAQHAGESLVIQAQDARNFGSFDPAAGDGSTFGLHQGYVQLSDEARWLRVGRQEINLGDQRLIGSADWNMPARAFDAVRAHAEDGAATLDAFGAVIHMQRSVVDAAGQTARSGGDYLSGMQVALNGGRLATLEVYGLYRHDGPTELDLARLRDIVALGARLFGELAPPLRYTLEVTPQVGTARSTARPVHAHRALGLAAELDWKIATPWHARLGGAFATGESRTSGWTEFDNFYPTNHKFYGIADLAGLRNLRELHAQLSLNNAENTLQASLGWVLLALASGEARWTDAAGRVLGQSVVAGSDLLGNELDATLRYTPDPMLYFEAGYALFIAASGAARLGHADSLQFAYLGVGAHLP